MWSVYDLAMWPKILIIPENNGRVAALDICSSRVYLYLSNKLILGEQLLQILKELCKSTKTKVS